MYRAILFDLDDTLYDLHAHWARQLHHVMTIVVAQYPHLNRETLVAAGLRGRVYIEHLPAFLHRQGIDDASLISHLHAMYRQRWFDELVLPAETATVLQELSQRYQLGLITNGPIWTQRPKIERFGLARWLHPLIVSEEVGVAKPDPAIFHLALQQLGVAPHEALYVGDSPEFDLVGAQAAGVPVVWLNALQASLPDGIAAPHATISCLSDLLGVLC